MSIVSRLTTATCAMLIAAGPALAADYGTTPSPAAHTSMMSSGSTGSRLMTADGMALYVFDKDSDGKSNCYAKCAKEWPPMIASASAVPSSANLSVIRRKNGTMQWAWMGRPLYMFDEDLAPGDMKGDSYSPDWHLARAMQ